MIPASDHTGTPRHFHSSTTSGAASLTRARTCESIVPRQSPSSAILASIIREAWSPALAVFFAIIARTKESRAKCKLGYVKRNPTAVIRCGEVMGPATLHPGQTRISGRFQLRHRRFRRVAQHVAAAPHGLDVVFA